MSIKHTHASTLTSDSGVSIATGKQTEVGNAELPISQSFAASSSGVTISTLAFTAANLQSFYLVADQNCTVVCAGPSLTITLVAGIEYYWGKSSGIANPFASNVTSATLSCTPATNLKGRILVS